MLSVSFRDIEPVAPAVRSVAALLLSCVVSCAGTGGASSATPRSEGSPPSVASERAHEHSPASTSAPDEAAEAVTTDVATPPEPAPAAEEPAEARAPKTTPLPSGTTVLHIGDSFAGALGYELNSQLKEAGVQGILKYEKSTYIPTWAWKKDFPSYLWKYKPDLIVVTLGGNELGIANPEKRAETVQRLVKRFDGIPCVWVGIPLWEGANPTLMRVIEDNSAPCQFIDSHALIPDMQRAKDKIHPSLSARKLWAQTVVRWLAENRRPDGEVPWAWKNERR